MQFDAKIRCTCGDAVTLSLPMGLESFAAVLKEWSKSHDGPEHRLRRDDRDADDTLPERLLKVPAPSGTAKGKVAEMDIMLPEYYQARGWTPEGVPSNETLDRLNLQG